MEPAELRTESLEVERASGEAAMDSLVNALMTQTSLPDGVSPRQAIGAVLCVLSLRLHRGEAEHLYTWAPPHLKPVFRLCARHRDYAPRLLDKDDFVESVTEHLGVGREASEKIIRGVMVALRHELSEVELRDLGAQLPPELKELWGERG